MRFAADVGELAVVLELDTEPAEVDLMRDGLGDACLDAAVPNGHGAGQAGRIAGAVAVLCPAEGGAEEVVRAESGAGAGVPGRAASGSDVERGGARELSVPEGAEDGVLGADAADGCNDPISLLQSPFLARSSELLCQVPDVLTLGVFTGPPDHLRCRQLPIGSRIARVPWIQLGSIGLSHGLWIGRRRAMIRTPPSRFTRRWCALIQARTRWLMCQLALSQTRSNARLPSDAKRPQTHPR
jgi:hypothetical protein